MSVDPRLAVVLGTYNRLDLLKRCIDSIEAETRTPTVIHVTDAGSTDGTVEYLQSIACDAIVPWLVGKKLGQAKALNDVFKTLTTPYVAWLSDDNVVADGGLDRGVRILDRCRKVGMVGLKVKDVQGPFVAAPYIGGVSETGVLNVNQGMLRTSVLREVGYFSEVFAFYGIDPDLTAMVLYSGHDIVYTQAVAVHHYREWNTDTSTEGGKALKAHHQKSLALYRAKYGGIGAGDDRWRRKKAAWAWFKAKLGKRYDGNSTRRVLGGIARDWNNSFNARHIHPLDPLLSLGKEHHLRQRVHPFLLPHPLPVDPDPIVVAAPTPVASGRPAS